MNPDALITDFLDLLDQESVALVTADAEQLGAMAARKDALLGQLAPELKSCLRAGKPIDRVRLRRAQELNHRNAQLLALQMHANRSRVDALLHAARAVPLYDAGGAVAVSAQNNLTRARA